MSGLKKMRAPVVVIVILGLAVIILAAAVVSQRISYAGVLTELERQSDTLSRRDRDTSTNRALAEDYEKLCPEIGGRFREVTWSGRMPASINQITGITKGLGIEIESLKPGVITSRDSVYRLPVSISLKASLGDLAKLVRELESATPVFFVEKMDIRASDGSSDKLSCDLVISSFAVADPDAPLVVKIDEKKPDESGGAQ